MNLLLAYTKTLIRRLEQLNQQRVDRALSLMSDASRRVFHLIPVLLHCHHPKVPGYSDEPVPKGVWGFHPDALQQQLMFEIGLPVDKAFLTVGTSEVLGLYTMGSTSSFGQSHSSDLDVWVCVSSVMSHEARRLLVKKCDALSEWAKALGVNASFFVMDEQRFRRNQSEDLSGENCGSSQHLLLLDEFYRSAVRIAGKRLLWQIVPPEMEACYDAYVSYLCSRSYIQCQEWFDFGQLHHIPAEEYFGASLWQLYKSIDSPYKSVLKAMLLEAYSWEYPHTQLLSLDAKRRFFAHEPDEYGMDPYFLMLEKVTRYLKTIGDHSRLDLVRRCFYLKTHEKLSREAGRESMPWRRHALQELSQQWHWTEDTLRELDNRRYWCVEQVSIIHTRLLDALMQSYRHLIQFARRNDITSSISPQDISILARKLYAAFEDFPGKVSLLNTQISPGIEEPYLSFIEVPEGRTNQAGWYLYKHPLVAEQLIGRQPLEHHTYLSKLVAWAFFNGVMSESTQLDAVIRGSQLDVSKLSKMSHDLRKTFPLKRPRPSTNALANPCEISQLAMFVNLDKDPTVGLSEAQLDLDMNRVEILNFGPKQLNLIGSIDFIYRNSWHEVRTLRFEGKTAMTDALKAILCKMHQDALPPESVDVFCYSQQLRGVIRSAVYHLLTECLELRLKPVEQEKRPRFKALRISGEMYGLFFERRGVSVQRLENSVDFYRSISTNKVNGSPFMLVEKEGAYQLPEAIDGFASEGLIQFFFEDSESGFDIYVLDEANKVEVYHQFNGDKDEMISSLNHFYSSVRDERQSHVSDAAPVNFNLPQYYQITQTSDGDIQIIPYRRHCPSNGQSETSVKLEQAPRPARLTEVEGKDLPRTQDRQQQKDSVPSKKSYLNTDRLENQMT